MMEFGDPLHISGIMIFISFISLMVGFQLGNSSKKAQKNTD